MKITIECNSLNELRDTVDQLVVLLPEHKSISEKETAAAPQKRKTFDKDKIIAAYKKGGTYTEIAEQIGCSYATVANTCKGIER